MNLDVLMNFLETANQKSIAKASISLNISHPALSKQIKKLEGYYGVSLFTRSAAGVELTAEGRLLYERLPDVLRELVSIRNELEQVRGNKKLTIGTLPSLAASFMPACIVAMEANGIEVQHNIQNTSELLMQGVLSGELDAAMVDQYQSSSFLWSRELFREPFFIVVPDKHHLNEKDSVSIREMGNESFIVYPKACSIRKCVTSLFESFGMSIPIKTEIPFGEYIVGFVAAGAGVAIVPKLTAYRMGYPNVKAIPIEETQASRTITLIAHSEKTGKLLYGNIKRQL